MICINFSNNQITAPNCEPTALINATLEMTDANGLVATATLSGTLENITAMDDLHPLRLLGGDGTFQQNGVTITETYPTNFEFYDTISGSLSMTDCKGISSVTPFVDTLNINNTIAVDDAPIFMNIGQTTNIASIIQSNDSDNQGDNQNIIAINGHNITNHQPTIINGFIIELTPDGALNFTPVNNTPLGNYSFNYLIEDDNINPAQDVAEFSIELVQPEPPLNTTEAVDDPIGIAIGENATMEIGSILLSNDVDIEGNNQVITHINSTALSIGTPTIIDGVEFELLTPTTLNATPQSGTNGVVNFTYSIQDDGSPIATDTANFSIEIVGVPQPNTTDAINDNVIQMEELQVIDIAPTLQSNDVDIEGDNQEITHINDQELQLGTPIIINEIEFVKINATTINAKPQTGSVGTKTFSYSIKDDGNPEAIDTANFSIQVTPPPPINLTAGITLDDNYEFTSVVSTNGTSYEQGGVNHNIEEDPNALFNDVFKIENEVLFSVKAFGGESYNDFIFENFHSSFSQDDINNIKATFSGAMGFNGYIFNDRAVHGLAVKIGLVTPTMADNGYSRGIERTVTYQNEIDSISTSSRTYSYFTFETNANTIEIDAITGGHIIDWGDNSIAEIYANQSEQNIPHTYTNIAQAIVWGAVVSIDFDDCNLIQLDVTRIHESLTVVKADNNNLSTLDISNMVNLTKVWVGSNNLSALSYQSLDKIFELTINNNSFTTVDITQLPLLKRLDIRNNQVSVLDITNNPLLEQLYISNNSINTIDLSNLPNIKQINLSSNNFTSLSGVNNLITLDTLVCSNNSINTLNVSNLINLKVLHVQNCGLNNLDVVNLVSMDTMVLDSNDFTTPIDVSGMNLLRYFTCIECGMDSSLVDTIAGHLLTANSTEANDFKIDGNNQPPTNLQTITDLETQGWTVVHS